MFELGQSILTLKAPLDVKGKIFFLRRNVFVQFTCTHTRAHTQTYNCTITLSFYEIYSCVGLESSSLDAEAVGFRRTLSPWRLSHCKHSAEWRLQMTQHQRLCFVFQVLMQEPTVTSPTSHPTRVHYVCICECVRPVTKHQWTCSSCLWGR